MTVRPLLQQKIEKLLTSRIEKLLTTVQSQDIKIQKITDVMLAVYKIKDGRGVQNKESKRNLTSNDIQIGLGLSSLENDGPIKAMNEDQIGLVQEISPTNETLLHVGGE